MAGARPKRFMQCVAASAFMLSTASAFAYDWLQFGGDVQHSGNNSAETTITPANVGALTLKYRVALPATVDGAPVFLESVSTAGGIKNLLFITTTDARIVALDAQTGAQVWSQQYNPAGCRINGTGGACYTTSSPAIDPNRQFVYSYGLDGYVHKLRVGDGVEITGGGWPQLTTWKGYDEKGSSALATATSGSTTYLYVVHGGYPGDRNDYQGHVTAINLATGAQNVFNAACSDQAVHLKHLSDGVPPTCSTPRNAIWSRPGVVYDAGTDRIVMGTGNGTYDGSNNGHNWSESVIALHPDGTGGSGPNSGKPVDSYTPANFQSLDDTDTDVGSTAPAILPVPASSAVQHLAVQSGKDGKLRLLNLANLSGQGGPGHVGGEIGAIINLPQGGGVFSQPAVWTNPADASTWVFFVNGNGASGLQLEFDANGNPSLTPRWQNAQSGTSPVVANNVLFHIGSASLRALDPLSGNLLWSATRTGGNHWESLIVANGVVCATDHANFLSAFALAQPTTTALASSANPSVLGASVTFTATVTGSAPTGSVAFTDGGSAISGCSAVALSSGSANSKTATCSTSSLTAGTHSMVASYGGDSANNGSTSATLSQVVNSGAQINVALASNGGVASASSTYNLVAGYDFGVASVNNNERAGMNWGHGGGWNDATSGAFPDWVQINFNGTKTIDHVVVYTLQDNYASPVEPTDTMTFTQYGVTDFTVQGWNGSAWVTLGTVSGNNLVKRTVNFTAFTTDRIRVNVTNALASYSRIVEIEAWGTSVGPGQINVASASNGGVPSASSTYNLVAGYDFGVASINNNERAGMNWGHGGGWNDATSGVFPDWVQINFNGTKTIDHVVVYTLQDNFSSPVEPTDTMTFSLYGITDFNVQGWNGSAWVTLGTVRGNNLVKRTVNFSAFTTDRIRVNVTNALASYSRIVEIEAWGN